MSRWDDSGTWEAQKLRREVFFFPSGDVELYGSIYAHASPGPSQLGVVFCNSWGYEANLASRFVHPVSIAVARIGGVALSFHYPGFGDSQGSPETTTLDVMAGAALDAVGEARRRCPSVRWYLGGLMLGASVACLAADRDSGIERLLLVQPALRPGRYFARLEHAAKRSLGAPAPAPEPGFAFGYPLARPLLDSALAADAPVEAALASFAGEGTIVSYAEPAVLEGAPERFERVRAPGTWRFGARDISALAQAAMAWLKQRAKAAA